jgi:hypothetical protein
MKRVILTVVAMVFVLSGSNIYAADLTDNGNGTVSDGGTKLMWQQAEPGIKKWQDAVTYCGNLSLAGHDDWRLPDLEEMKSLIDERFSQPAIDTKYFPDFPHTRLFFWTSTEAKDHPKYKAYVVIFNTGSEDAMSKGGKRYTKCVRGGK